MGHGEEATCKYLYPSQVKNLIKVIKLLLRERSVLLSALCISVKGLKHTYCLALGYSEKMSSHYSRKNISSYCAYLV